jgi:hypothetical protein
MRERNRILLSHMDALCRSLVQILDGKTKQLIIQAPPGLLVPITVREERSIESRYCHEKG